MRVIRVALLGYGVAGSFFHAPVIGAIARLKIKTVMTSRVADVARDLPDAIVVATPEQIFADPSIELVVVATPNATHADLAARALRAGKHVVIDKPMTTSSVEADTLIALAQDRERLLSVYHNRRWDGGFLTLRQCIDEGRLGHVYRYEAHFDRFRPTIKPGWRAVRAPGAGVLYDLGSHLIDEALTLFGRPETVVADVLVQRPQALVDDYFALTLGYPDRRIILYSSTLVADPGPRYAVHGDGGSFIKYGLDPQEAQLRAGLAIDSAAWGRDDPANYGNYVAADGTRERVPTVTGSYAGYYAGIAAAIIDGAPNPVPAEQARDVIRVIEWARQSALERRTVAALP